MSNNHHQDEVLVRHEQPFVYYTYKPCTTTENPRRMRRTSNAAASLWPSSIHDNVPPSTSSSSLMRKVRSLDFTALLHHHDKSMASKFSSEQRHSLSHCGRQRSTSFSLLDSSQDSLEDSEEQKNSLLMKLSSPWTVVCGIMMLFMTLNLVHARHHSGIVETTRLQHYTHSKGSSSSLGSAAISSITETLSPILPFTGGVDLRREFEQDHVSWYDTASALAVQVRDAFGLQQQQQQVPTVVFSIPRAGSQLVANKKRKAPPSTTQYPFPISSSKPFYSTNKIAELNLSDLTELFQYTMEQNRPGFDRNKFINNKASSERVKAAILEMDAAVQQSRGGNDIPSTITTTTDSTLSTNTGDVDALYFCAVLRIFAEWRLLRQVPHGYKGYAVGMNLGHRDIVQNLGKMETAVHAWLHHQNELVEMQRAYDENTAMTLSSPTLRDLLEHEIDLQLHSKLPRLKEKSAAMGLLWVRRQLHYQTALFGNILEVPSNKFPTSHAAVSDAYKQVYGQYHGWAVQKIFNYSFQAAPDVKEIYKFMNPSLLERVQEKAKRDVVVVGEDVKDNDSSSLLQSSSTQDDKKNPFERFFHHIGSELDKFGKHVGGELDKFGKHVGGEWDKLVDNVVRVFDQDTAKNREATRIRGGSSMDTSNEHIDHFVSQKMAQDAHERIEAYLTQVEPLLQDLAGLFDDLNMDDPTKV